MLGRERFALANVISQEGGEEQDTSATRVWAAIECLKKAGGPVDAPLVMASSTDDGWVLLASGALTIATCVASVREHQEPLVLAVLVRNDSTKC